MLNRTLEGIEARPSQRFEGIDVPPELDAVCARACALDPADRFATARELGHAVDAYLRGDRDLALRRHQAREHAREADEAAGRALHGGADEERGRSLRLLGRALALDPDNRDALRTLTRLLSSPPRTVPPEVEDTLRADSRRQLRLGGLAGGITFLVAALLVLSGGVGGLDEPVSYGISAAFLLTGSALGWLAYARADPPRALLYGMMVSVVLATVVLSRYWSPWVMIPGMLSATGIAFCMMWGWKHRAVIISVCTAGFLAALAADVLGLWEPTYFFAGGRLHVGGGMGPLEEVPVTVLFIIATLTMIIGPALFVGYLREHSLSVERQLHLQTWQLRQLAPEGDGAGEADRGSNGPE